MLIICQKNAEKGTRFVGQRIILYFASLLQLNFTGRFKPPAAVACLPLPRPTGPQTLLKRPF
jgi:hypothetical protein